MKRILFSLTLVALFIVSSTSASAETLSNETTFTRWAYTALKAPIYKHSGGKGGKVAYTRFKTEDGLPELYVGLQSKTVGGQKWIQIRIPKRPNGKTGWVKENVLGPWHVNRKQIIVDRYKKRLSVYKSNKKIFSARIAIGTSANPTPGGYFYIREKLNGFRNPAYGPRVLATSAYAPKLSDWPGGGIVGIHGTNQPNLIPRGRVSHGCIRMYNNDVKKLYRLVDLGTPILIQ